MRFPERVLIVGASARAAASSALRAGFRPRCLDQFADADLAAVCPVDRFDPDRDADDLKRLAVASACDAWLYVGSMEARPDLVERVSRVVPLLGTGPEALGLVRDPWRVADALRGEGLATPALRRLADGIPATGRWLAKSTVVAGGLGARRIGDPGDVPPTHFQEYVDGPTFSGLFVAAGGEARLIGTARQFQGFPEAPFLYRGGVAPWPVPEGAAAELRRVGNALARRCELAGLFGVDFVLADGRPWALEVNPRYTASVELFEYSGRRTLMRDHVRACVAGELGGESERGGSVGAVGKRVVYARRRLTFPAVAPPPADGFRAPGIADVPRAGATIAAGAPVLTVFARARTPRACAARLDRIEAAWVGRLEREG